MKSMKIKEIFDFRLPKEEVRRTEDELYSFFGIGELVVFALSALNVIIFFAAKNNASETLMRTAQYGIRWCMFGCGTVGVFIFCASLIYMIKYITEENKAWKKMAVLMALAFLLFFTAMGLARIYAWE